MNLAQYRQESFQASFERLRTEYIHRLKKGVRAVDNILAQKQLGNLTTEDFKRAYVLAHGFAGSGATFGFPDVSREALVAEKFIYKIVGALERGESVNNADLDQFFGLMSNLRAVFLDVKQAPSNESNIKRASPVPHVLVIDDDGILAGLVAARLTMDGLDVRQAKDGLAAMVYMGEKKPDLVILDIDMPGISGIETLKRMKQSPDYLDIPVLILTASSKDNDLLHALHSGAIEYMVKPLDTDILAHKVNDILKLTRRRILILDNDPLILELLARKYEDNGFEVISVNNGKVAWKKISSIQPDLVILDRLMPETDGMTVLRRMRKNHETKNIPVIIISSLDSKKDISEGLAGGANDYVTKPFLVDDLLQRSMSLLSFRAAA